LRAEAARILKTSATLSYSAGVNMQVFRLLNSVDPSFPIPFIFNLPVASASSTPSFLAPFGFTDVRVEPVKYVQRFKSAEQLVETLKVGMKQVFGDEERNKRVLEKVREEQGEGEVTLSWEWIAVTAMKA
jgi:hypothetical protein